MLKKIEGLSFLTYTKEQTIFCFRENFFKLLTFTINSSNQISKDHGNFDRQNNNEHQGKQIFLEIPPPSQSAHFLKSLID